jgi:hypothetical protein
MVPQCINGVGSNLVEGKQVIDRFFLCVYDRVCKVPRVLFNICVCERKLIVLVVYKGLVKYMVLGVYNGLVKYMVLEVYNGVVKYMVLEEYNGVVKYMV